MRNIHHLTLAVLAMVFLVLAAFLAGCGGGGGGDSASASLPPGGTSPVTPAFSISDVKVAVLSSTEAQVSWKTSSRTNCVLHYGTTTDCTQTITNVQPGTDFSTGLSSLSPYTTYYLRITGTDGSGAVVTSQNYTFTTKSVPVTTAVLDAHIVRPDVVYDEHFNFASAAYYSPSVAPDYTSKITLYGRAYPSNPSTYVAIRLSGYRITPTKYNLTQGGLNFVQIGVYMSNSSTLDTFVSTSGEIDITQVGALDVNNYNWNGTFSCTAYCVKTGKTIQLSGQFDLPQTTASLPISL